MCQCFCCGLGERLLKRVFWFLWFVFALLPLVVETLIVLLPVRYLMTLLHHERESVFSGAAHGAILGTVFSAFAHVYASDSYPGAWCSGYMGVLSFYCGHVLIGWLVYLNLAHRWPLYDQWACFRSQYSEWYRARTNSKTIKTTTTKTPTGFRLSQLSPGGYCGFTVGFIVTAFSVLSTQSVSQQADLVPLVEWCRPSPHIHLYLVCLPLFGVGMLKNMAELDQVRHWPVPHPRAVKPILRHRGRNHNGNDDDDDDDEDMVVPSTQSATIATMADSSSSDMEIGRLPASASSDEAKRLARRYQELPEADRVLLYEDETKNEQSLE